MAVVMKTAVVLSNWGRQEQMLWSPVRAVFLFTLPPRDPYNAFVFFRFSFLLSFSFFFFFNSSQGKRIISQRSKTYPTPKLSEMPFKNRDWFRDSSPHTHTHPPPPPSRFPSSPHHFWVVLFVTESGRRWWAEMLCELVIYQHHSAWCASGKTALEWCYRVFTRPNVEAPLFSSLKLCHCQYCHSWWCFKLLFTRGLKFRNAKWFPMTVVTMHWGKPEQESQPLTITGNCESPVNFPVFMGFWMPIQYSYPCRSNWRSLSVYTSFLKRLGFNRGQ